MKLLCLIASLSAVSEAFQVQHGSIRGLQKKKVSAAMKEMSTTTTTITTTTTTSKSAWYPSRSSRAGKYLPTDHAVVDDFIEFLRECASTVGTEDYIQPIKDFQVARRAEPAVVCCGIRDGETVQKGLDSALDTPAVKHCDAFLGLC